MQIKVVFVKYDAILDVPKGFKLREVVPIYPAGGGRIESGSLAVIFESIIHD